MALPPVGGLPNSTSFGGTTADDLGSGTFTIQTGDGGGLPGSRKGTWFWCAPELGYLPLKIERRDGKNVVFSMRLKQIQR